MNLFELSIIAVGLSMDAFAVAICKGLSMYKMKWDNAVIIATYFGGFQAGMPLVGYLLGMQFQDKISAFDHWVAFVLLALIGGKMIWESREKACDEDGCSVDFRSMAVLALATSIDALAVGVTLAFLNVSIVPAISFIGIITFVLSLIGVKIGNVFGGKFKSKAELAGGIILIGMGLKTVLEHTGVINF